MKNEFRDLVTEDITKAKISFTGIPFDGNASVGSGARFAPNKFRELSEYLPAFTMDGKSIEKFPLFDYGDIEKNADETGEMYFQRIQKEVSQRMGRDGLFPFFIGGDHSVAIPLEKAFFDYAKSLGKIPAIVHLDAHPDICFLYEDNVLSHASVNARSIEYGYETENIVLLGMRGFEKQEVQYFHEHPEILMIPSNTLHEKGIAWAIEEVSKKFDDRYLVYLSFDIDIDDPSIAPGTGTPEAFGLTGYQTMQLITGLIKKLPVAAMDCVEISPSLDVTNQITTWLGLKIFYEVIYTLLQKGEK